MFQYSLFHPLHINLIIDYCDALQTMYVTVQLLQYVTVHCTVCNVCYSTAAPGLRAWTASYVTERTSYLSYICCRIYTELQV